MRVRISHREKKAGFFGLTRQVEVTTEVEFSREERAIIAERQLADRIILERFPDSRTAAALDKDELERWLPGFHLRIGDLLRASPDRFRVDDPHAAKLYETQLTEALRQLKAFIADNARTAPPTALRF